MTLELTAEEQAALKSLVDAGEYATVEDAARGALQKTVDDYNAWLAYARKAIDEGLEDADNGQFTDAETFLRELEARVRTAA